MIEWFNHLDTSDRERVLYCVLGGMSVSSRQIDRGSGFVVAATSCPKKSEKRLLRILERVFFEQGKIEGLYYTFLQRLRAQRPFR